MARIIIVDDSATIRQQVRRALECTGLSIAEAVDGKDGLKKINADSEIDVVILDVNLPRMNGIEMTEALAANGRVGRWLKIVMLTTKGHAELIQRAKAAGAKGWLVKPFKPEMLLATVQKMVA